MASGKLFHLVPKAEFFIMMIMAYFNFHDPNTSNKENLLRIDCMCTNNSIINSKLFSILITAYLWKENVRLPYDTVGLYGIHKFPK